MAAYQKALPTTLETERLILRQLAEADAPRIQELFPNPNVVRYLATEIPWPYPEDGAVQFLRHLMPELEARESYYWAILLKGQEEVGLIGLIELTPSSDEDHRGFWLGEPYWGQGLMREAASAVNDFAFDVLGMREMLLNSAEPNVASHRLKESVGAEIVSIEEKPFVGGVFPSVRWRLTAEAWRRHRSNG